MKKTLLYTLIATLSTICAILITVTQTVMAVSNIISASGNDTVTSSISPNHVFEGTFEEAVDKNRDNWIFGYYHYYDGSYVPQTTLSQNFCNSAYISVDGLGTISITGTSPQAGGSVSIMEYGSDFKMITYSKWVQPGEAVQLHADTKYVRFNIWSYIDDQDKTYEPWVNGETNIGIVYTPTYTKAQEMDMQNSAILNNPDNWLLGCFYKHYLGTLVKDGTEKFYTACEPSLYVLPDTTYYMSSTSTLRLTVHEFAEDGTHLGYTFMCDKDSITTKKETSYLKISLYNNWTYSSAQAIDFISEGSLKMHIASEYISEQLPVVAVSEADFSNRSGLINGQVSSNGFGLITLSTDIAMLNRLYEIDSTSEYVCHLPNAYIQMKFVQFDEDKNYIGTISGFSGAKITFDSNTKYFGIYFDEKNDAVDYDASFYKDIITAYNMNLLTVYEKYNHNTTMHDLSTWDFVSNINVGWNLGNSLGTTPTTASGYDANLTQETCWGQPYITEDLIEAVADSGFNAIRVPATFYTNSGRDENGRLMIGEKWLNRVQDVIDYALKNDLSVLLSTMTECISSNPVIYVGVEDEAEWTQVKQDAYDLWYQIATKFVDYDEKLVFEAYNEIGSLLNSTGSGGYDKLSMQQVNELNQIFVNAVRATGGNNANRIIVVQPFNQQGAREDYLEDFVLPTDTIKDRLMVSVHAYESGWDGKEEWVFEMLENYMERWNTPIIITEFGMAKSDLLNPIRENHYSDYVARAAYHGIKCYVWDNGSNYMLLNRFDLDKSNISLIKALMDGAQGTAYCSVNGTTNYVFDEINDFQYGSLTTDGIILKGDGTNWIGLVPQINDSIYIEIPEGADMLTVNSVKREDVGYSWIRYVYWYDVNKEYLGYSKYSIANHSIFNTAVMDGAKYCTVYYYDPVEIWKMYDIYEWLYSGVLSLSMTFTDFDSYQLEPVILDNHYDYSQVGYRKFMPNYDIPYEALENSRTDIKGFVLGGINTWGDKDYKEYNYYVLDYYKTVDGGAAYTMTSSNPSHIIRVSEFDAHWKALGIVTVTDGIYVAKNNAKYVIVELGGLSFAESRKAFLNDGVIIDIAKQ